MQPAAPRIGAQEQSVHHDPSLRVIAVLVALKSLAALSVVAGLELLGPSHVRQWIDSLIGYFHWDPDSKILGWLLAQLNPQSFHFAAAVILVYACLHGAEAWGLWLDQRWASWFGCIGAALYLPMEILALWRHRDWLPAAVLLINIVVVLVLARNIRVLNARRTASAGN